MTCNLPAHCSWYKAFTNRFGRLSFPGVQRVIRRSVAAASSAFRGTHSGNPPLPDPNNNAPDLQVRLPTGPEGQAGGDVVHRFRAGKIYCVQTVQYACGVTIGWGKCYRSESPSQVIELLTSIFPTLESRPSYIFYDNACKLLAHIVSNDEHHPWLRSTRFLCDSWHYINHRATDILCRWWCNSAPADGSQPDLVISEADANGNVQSTRAFNTETAEQLNAWLSGYEGPLRQMTNSNFDFTMHVLMLMYKEDVEDRIEKREAGDSGVQDQDNDEDDDEDDEDDEDDGTDADHEMQED